MTIKDDALDLILPTSWIKHEEEWILQNKTRVHTSPWGFYFGEFMTLSLFYLV